MDTNERTYVTAADLMRAANFLEEQCDRADHPEAMMKVAEWIRRHVSQRYEAGRRAELAKGTPRDRLTEKQKIVLQHLETRYPAFVTIRELQDALPGGYAEWHGVHPVLVALEKRGFVARLRPDNGGSHAWYAIEEGPT